MLVEAHMPGVYTALLCLLGQAARQGGLPCARQADQHEQAHLCLVGACLIGEWLSIH